MLRIILKIIKIKFQLVIYKFTDYSKDGLVRPVNSDHSKQFDNEKSDSQEFVRSEVILSSNMYAEKDQTDDLNSSLEKINNSDSSQKTQISKIMIKEENSKNKRFSSCFKAWLNEYLVPMFAIILEESYLKNNKIREEVYIIKRFIENILEIEGVEFYISPESFSLFNKLNLKNSQMNALQEKCSKLKCKLSSDCKFSNDGDNTCIFYDQCYECYFNNQKINLEEEEEKKIKIFKNLEFEIEHPEYFRFVEIYDIKSNIKNLELIPEEEYIEDCNKSEEIESDGEQYDFRESLKHSVVHINKMNLNIFKKPSSRKNSISTKDIDIKENVEIEEVQEVESFTKESFLNKQDSVSVINIEKEIDPRSLFLDVQLEKLLEIYSIPDEKFVTVKKNKTYILGKITANENPILLVRGRVKLKANKDVLFKLIYDLEIRSTWDNILQDMTVIEKIDAQSDVIYSYVKGVMGASDRDFLQLRKFYTNFKEFDYVIVMKSSSHPDKPLVKKKIRAETIISGYLIKTIDEEHCELGMISQTDIKGFVPKFLVNVIAPKKPVEWFKKLEKALLKYNKEN